MILDQFKNNPDAIEFSDVIDFIDENYEFKPVQFSNGKLINEIDENNGSCKIFSFSKLHSFSKEQTLALFGKFYRVDVLQNPNGIDHQNIRNFMEFGWSEIKFSNEALVKK